MSDTHVTLLTPPGTGAIATLAVTGPNAWAILAKHFRPANGKALPASPVPYQYWFGTLGDGVADEVVVAVKSILPVFSIEVHCHGGRQVVRWLTELLVQSGCVETDPCSLPVPGFDALAVTPLTLALTVRTASVLLDQHHGAFRHAVKEVLALFASNNDLLASERFERLARYASLGQHLVSPWKVVIAGPPNVGKSSLINALVGYQRSVVAAVAGTTRDAVTTTIALDGWPVELTDTAGLREATEALESSGIDRAYERMANADLVVWVVDATETNPIWPESRTSCPWLYVVNKTDQPTAWDWDTASVELQPISATTGVGIQILATIIIRTLIPHVPGPGEAVPFTSQLAALIHQAQQQYLGGDTAAATFTLTSCLSGST